MKTITHNWQLFISCLLLIFAVTACGGGEEPTAEAPVDPTAVTEVQTVVVVATPTPEPTTEVVEEAAPVDSSSEETAVSEEAPVLEAPAASAGSPTMTTLTALNVRTGPGTQYRVIGSLPAGATAEIIGKSPNGHWWKIACPSGTGAECWASAGAQYSSAANAGGVPVASVPPAPTHAPAATATATATNTGNATATYTPTVNPSVSPSPTATTDVNATATYTPTPTATSANNATATYTPTATATTAVVQQAPFDNDSLQNPAQSLFLSITGVRNFTHANDVSYENGDQDDWVEFEFPNNSNPNQVVWITLDCTITGDPEAQLRATVYEDGNSTNKIVICNQGETQLTVDNTKTQQVRIHFGITKPDIYATYTLTVVGFK